jgi:DNA-binding MarR family transcriptional regulator
MVQSRPTIDDADLPCLRGLTEVLERLNETHPDMTVRAAKVLLQVAAEEGLTQSEIIHKHGYTKTTVNRIIYLLTDKGTRGDGTGLRLVEKQGDGDDDRKKPLWLTPRGRRLVQDMIATLKRVST